MKKGRKENKPGQGSEKKEEKGKRPFVAIAAGLKKKKKKKKGERRLDVGYWSGRTPSAPRRRGRVHGTTLRKREGERNSFQGPLILPNLQLFFAGKGGKGPRRSLAKGRKRKCSMSGRGLSMCKTRGKGRRSPLFSLRGEKGRACAHIMGEHLATYLVEKKGGGKKG